MRTASGVGFLSGLRFGNAGTVRRDMRLEYRTRQCFYMEDVGAWSTHWAEGAWSCLYEIRDTGAVPPPSGIRSSVPLGGLGTGTIELRADGSLREWTIFNNFPRHGLKVDWDDLLFGIRVGTTDAAAVTRALRTHPPMALPGVEQIDYAGAFPV